MEAAIRQVVHAQIGAAGEEASANLRTWAAQQQEVAKAVQQVQAEKQAMQAEAEAMKAMLLKGSQDFETLKLNLAQMQNQRDVVVAELSAKSESVETIIAKLNSAQDDATLQVRQLYGGMSGEIV